MVMETNKTMPIEAEKTAAPQGLARGTSRRTRPVVNYGETARGAPERALNEPASAYLAGVVWAGVSPDPDGMDAATFLMWL